MAKTARLLSIILVSVALFNVCPAKPTGVQETPLVETDIKREQRSPQFGFPNEYNYGNRPGGCGEFGCEGGFGAGEFYPEGGAASANAQSGGSNGGLFGGSGAALANAESGGFNGGPFGGSGASANAQSGGLFGGPGGAVANAGSGGLFGGSGASASAEAAGANAFGDGESQASAQSANFSLGPYSASFSIADSSANSQRF
ncbi:uncharacterized protein LOC143348777 [Colletes latitarsis]|uniref:uncharacterized protein LOC143348777 n=1 Tax=Colletes latitarsis TaxID=2605962 RepID=UPI004035F830